MFSRLNKRTKIYSLITFFLFIAVIALGVLPPVLLNNTVKNWNKILIDKTDNIENIFYQTFDKKSNRLINVSSELKNVLRKKLDVNDPNFRSIFELLTTSFKNYSVQLYDPQNQIFAWNAEPVYNENEFVDSSLVLNQTYFTGRKLITYLTLADTLHVKNSTFTIICSLPMERHYSLTKEKLNYSNIADSLSTELGIAVQINFSPSAERSKDGRKYSFAILNNFKNKIGIVTVDKPSLDAELNNYGNLLLDIQNILIVLIVVVIGLWFKPFILSLRFRIARFFVLAAYILGFRVLLFVLGIPSSFLNNALTNASNFSSVFAYGMVRSPLEFSLSVVAVGLIAFIAFGYLNDWLMNEVLFVEKKIIHKTLAIILIPIYLLTLRGLGASIRSVVFDSTIRYFKVFSLFPDLPAFVMEFNILLLSFSVFLLCVMFAVIFFKIFSVSQRKKNKIIFLWTFIAFQISGWLLDLLQSEPQGTPVLRLIFITITFYFAYLLVFRGSFKIFHLVYYAIASSVIVVGLLSYYNSEIERESLKTTAQELTRTNENVVEFMVYQTLFQTVQNNEIKTKISNKVDLSPAAFELWLRSLLYRESVRSAIKFFDADRNYIGGFETTSDFPNNLYIQSLNTAKDSLVTYKQANLFGDEITLTGISPVKKENHIIGFVVVAAIYDEDYFNFSYLPDFLVAPKAGISSALDFDKIKVFDFHDNQFVRYYGNVSLTNEEQKQILNADYSQNDEAWIRMNINGEENLVYALKIKTPSDNKVLAVSLEIKTYSWNLSNFFKIFFVHALIILFFTVVFFLFRLKSFFEYLSTYRSRLIVAFLIVSVIPLLAVAVYFRDLTEEKNTDLMEKRLDEMTRQVESYLNIYANESSLNLNTICEKASTDLGINFSIYDEEKLLYSPEQNFVDAGLLPTVLNAVAFKDCFLSKNQKLFISEPFEGQFYNSDYSKFQLAGQNYILNVNDLFNKITFPISDVELDFFLFGIFSLAVILLIILSTFLAEQISAPIRKLTMATRSVGTGDFNVEVENKTRGEIRELIDGFNQMVTRIKQSQLDIARLERETAWKEMAKQVAHEIKNPLTPMKLSIQQLIAAYKDKSPKFDSIFDKVTTTIISQIETLKNIASEFSNFARMPRINIAKFNLVNAIQESINLFGDEKISIRFNKPIREMLINADEDQLKRTIINMIRNSIQAKAVNMIVELTTIGNICELRITDDGYGIKQEFIAKIFMENFTTKQSGMGLGLSMARKYIESIDGSISVERTSEKGTVFLIKIPLAE